jgi:hypothetical protein
VQQCTKCGETGHDIRTCTAASEIVRHCSNCGQTGHDIRKCPAASRSRGRRCSNCGQPGHNIATCNARLGASRTAASASMEDSADAQRGSPSRVRPRSLSPAGVSHACAAKLFSHGLCTLHMFYAKRSTCVPSLAHCHAGALKGSACAEMEGLVK